MRPRLEARPEPSNAMRRPSGDQSNPLTAISDAVSCSASPPSRLIAKIWFLSSFRGLRNASHLLSGDHLNAVADFFPCVS